jgi:dihydroorotate dehydrogenase (NAD+) catalytic subunit
MTASGTAGHGAELGAYFDLSALGAVVVKSLSAEPWGGNPAPRLLPVVGGMLNSVGLQNPGIAAWAQIDLPALAKARARTVVSVWGRSAGEYAEVGRKLAEALAGAPAGQRSAVVAVEANISCPNIEDRQRMFSHSAEGTAAALGPLIEALKATGLPVWAKLSPNVTDLVAIASAALASGAVALTLVNTLMGLAVDPATGLPRLGGGGGGLSGPALHTVAVRAVYECRRAFPAAAIVGVGGVNSG